MLDVDKLSKMIAAAASESFSASRAKHRKDEILGYAILSHDTADSCCAAVATQHGLKGFVHGEDNDFLFSPPEWDEFDNGTAFASVNNELIKAYDEGDYEIDPDWHEKFREDVFEATVQGLEILVRQGFFGMEEERNRLYLAFCLSDSETFTTHLPSWVSKLNTDRVTNKFLAWQQGLTNAY